ncbi:Hypothetical predicted protein [Olea europaea subsp. europaea]|uniref:Uncharacterized protein n=1 Tax=Olea europaea subsp. europaea TaxID=158383 RepID=A0A8S0PVQ3_OLEEU|nr:Hypothetical predicted protein [Olea europaea subsp. europaea]
MVVIQVVVLAGFGWDEMWGWGRMKRALMPTPTSRRCYLLPVLHSRPTVTIEALNEVIR